MQLFVTYSGHHLDQCDVLSTLMDKLLRNMNQITKILLQVNAFEYDISYFVKHEMLYNYVDDN